MKAAKVEQFRARGPRRKITRATTSIHTQKGTRVLKIIVCERSKKGEHAGVHVDLPLPDSMIIDTVLIIAEPGKRAPSAVVNDSTTDDDITTLIAKAAKFDKLVAAGLVEDVSK